MKHTSLLRIALRFWIAMASVFSFLVGWVMLAHSPKPVANSASAVAPQAVLVGAAPTLAPLPSLDLSSNSNSGGVQVPQLSIQQPSGLPGQAPVFTTGGS